VRKAADRVAQYRERDPQHAIVIPADFHPADGGPDRNTQRVAFRVGESEDLVVETGLYNLTQDDAPVLVHFGPEQVENWLLVRLEQPAEPASAAQ
jgi:hypothetical protein